MPSPTFPRNPAGTSVAREARWRTILGALHEGVVLQDADGNIVEANPAAEQLLGLSSEQLRGRTSLDPRWRAVREDGTPCPGAEHPASLALRTGLPQRDVVMGLHTTDGRLIWFLVTAVPIFASGQDGPTGVVASFIDITARKCAEDALRASEARFRLLAEQAQDIIFRYRLWPDRAFEYVSPAATALIGYTPDEYYADPDLLGRVVHPDDRATFFARLADGDFAASPLRWVRKDGAVIATEQRVTPVRDAAGRLVAYEGIVRDVTARVALEAELAHRATHDVLTGLPNRALFLDRLAGALARAGRNGTHLAVLYLDLDGFKRINDTLGHAAGDTLLASVATRLGKCARAGDTPARLGGDEFAVLLEPIADPADAALVARRIRAALGRPVHIGAGEARIAASIGIAVSTAGDTADSLLGAADAAMYRAKRADRRR